MPKSTLPSSLYPALRDLIRWLKECKTRGVVIGGVAASFLGRSRTTADVDALILTDESKLDVFLQRGGAFGFYPRISEPLSFAKQSRMLLVNHKPSGVDVDISLGCTPFEEEIVKSAFKIRLKNISFPVPSPENLIIMKALVHRPRDAADIEGILDAQTKIDFKYIRKTLRDISIALDMPEILEDFDGILARRQKRRKRKF